MTEKPKGVRNAFVVDPQGVVEVREMPENVAPLVNSLENIRNILLKEKAKREGKDT